MTWVAPEEYSKVPQQHRRQHSRLRVRLASRAMTRFETFSTILLDISVQGARIVVPAPIPLASEVVLTWGSYETFGEVAWCEGGNCGISLFDPLPQDLILATRALDDYSRLPRDRDLARQSAKGWVEGKERL